MQHTPCLPQHWLGNSLCVLIADNHSLSQSGSISEIGSLLDILRQVPTLLDILTADSQKALSATCKSCHTRFIAQVQVVTVGCEEDYAWVLKLKWPRLRMVILQNECRPSDCRMGADCRLFIVNDDKCFLNQSSTTRIYSISVASEGKSQATIALLRPQHCDAADLPCTILAAQQLADQLRARFPSMNAFATSCVQGLDGLSLEIVSQLVQGPCSGLASLCLSNCELKPEGFYLLSQGNWTWLQFLDVSGNCLDAEGMMWLAQGEWPGLNTLRISFDHMMDATAIAHLSMVTWSLRRLFITDMPISADMAAELADLPFPKLRGLYLEGSGLTAAAVSELARADWRTLKVLSICLEDLSALSVLQGFDLEKVFDPDAHCSYTAEMHHRDVYSQLGVILCSNIKFSNHDVRLLLTTKTKIGQLYTPSDILLLFYLSCHILQLNLINLPFVR